MPGGNATVRVVRDNRALVLAQVQGRLDAVGEQHAGFVHRDASVRAPRRTGHLAGSGEVKRVAPMVYQVAFLAAYAIYLELGTSRAAAQPFLVPALLAYARAYRDACARALGAR
jgi:hypothetical protein